MLASAPVVLGHPKEGWLALAATLLALVCAGAVAACGGSGDDRLVVYSGRTADLITPLVDVYEERIGKKLDVRFAETPELAATLVEEGDASPADVFLSQDAGALGAVDRAGLLRRLPAGILGRVEPRFRARDGDWVGVSARARVIAYAPARVRRRELPRSVLDLTDPRWRDKVGWAPTNASFQAFVTALRRLRGEAAAERWLRGMVANDTQRYENNIAVRDAIASGEIDVGLINHYYVAEAKAQDPDYPVEIDIPPGGDPGALVNVAGAAILKSSDKQEEARRFLAFLLSPTAQRYFAEKTKEYPVIDGVPGPRGLPALASIRQPDLDLSSLADLQGTERLIERSGAL